MPEGSLIKEAKNLPKTKRTASRAYSKFTAVSSKKENLFEDAYKPFKDMSSF